MKNFSRRTFTSLAVCGSLLGLSPVHAQEVIKIGIVGPYTGPFAVIGEAFKHGVEGYMALHGDTVGGRKVQIIYRDSGGADPSLSKRLAEELIVKDKVSMLGGFYLTPEAAATAPVVNAAKVPLFIFVAATPGMMKMSPMFVRLGQSIDVPVELGAVYARQAGKSRGFVAVADYAPGHIVEKAFIAKFKAEGGEIVGNMRIPLNTADFAPIAERIANAKPDMLQVFLPPGAVSVSFAKALGARGLTSKTMIIGMGEAEDSDLPLFDDSIVGFKSIAYVDAGSKNPENVKFSQWLLKNAGPDARTHYFNVGAYDAMHLMYKVLRDQAGKPFDSAAAVKSLAGFSYQSPRGPVTIDAATRENKQNFYLREVVKEGGEKRNKVIKVWEQVSPPGAQ